MIAVPSLSLHLIEELPSKLSPVNIINSQQNRFQQSPSWCWKKWLFKSTKDRCFCCLRTWPFSDSQIHQINLPRPKRGDHTQVSWNNMEIYVAHLKVLVHQNRIQVWYCFFYAKCNLMFVLKSIMHNQMFILFIGVIGRAKSHSWGPFSLLLSGLVRLDVQRTPPLSDKEPKKRNNIGFPHNPPFISSLKHEEISKSIDEILTMEPVIPTQSFPKKRNAEATAPPLGICWQPPLRIVARYVSNPSNTARRHASEVGEVKRPSTRLEGQEKMDGWFDRDNGYIM